MAKFDLILKGGRLLDPANGLDAPRDLGIAGGHMAGGLYLIREISSKIELYTSFRGTLNVISV